MNSKNEVGKINQLTQYKFPEIKFNGKDIVNEYVRKNADRRIHPRVTDDCADELLQAVNLLARMLPRYHLSQHYLEVKGMLT